MGDTKKTYEVGKNKPPKEHTFKAGHKGMGGRPKGSKGRLAIIRKVLDETIPATVAGKKTRLPTTEIAVRQLGQKVCTGDLSAIRDVLRLAQEVEEASEKALESQFPFSDADREVIAEIYERMKRSKESGQS